MSEEQLKAFLEKVKADTSLQEKLKAEGADVVAIAKAAGFSITTEDLNLDLNSHRLGVNDDELEGVAGGGGPPWTQKVVLAWSLCKCNTNVTPPAYCS